MDSKISFTLKYWCMWHSAATEHAKGWPDGEILTGSADVGFMPMMQRRRLSPLAKAACAVAWRARLAEADMPTVFYSAHGESRYYFEMLDNMTSGEAVSPSRFSLAVHNAIAGQFSLYTESRLPYLCLAGGGEGIFAAFLEAAGILLDAPNVMLIAYEQPLPEIYHENLPASADTWSLAMVLENAGASGRQLHLQRQIIDRQQASEIKDQALIQAILAGHTNGSSQLEQARWHWSLDELES